MDCIFCRIAAGEIPAKKVLENEHVVAFHDLHAQAPTHVLVIPRRHIVNVGSSTAADVEALGQVVLACREVAEKTGIDQSGFRVTMNTGGHAGQSVDHLHAHVMGGRPMAWPPG
jgi:histidine triad (HIT) family protein